MAVLQSCPTFDTLRRQAWPSATDLHEKLWGSAGSLRRTADFASAYRPDWSPSMAGNPQEEEEEWQRIPNKQSLVWKGSSTSTFRVDTWESQTLLRGGAKRSMG